MKKIGLVLTALTMVAMAANAQLIYSKDWSGDTDDLAAVPDWDVQGGAPAWHVAGGQMTTSANWVDAKKSWGAESGVLNVGDKLIVTTSIDLSKGTVNNGTLLSVGLSDSGAWAGSAITPLGMTINIYQGGFFLRGLGDTNVDGGWVNGDIDADTITMVGEFTKSATTGVFDAVITMSNSVGQVGTTLSTPLTAAGVYGSSLEVGYETCALANLGANVGVNSISYELVAIPEPATLGLLGLAGTALYVRRRMI